MCLDTNQNQIPLIAEEDITVYKLLRNNGDGRLLSMYRYMHYQIGEEYTSELKYFTNEYPVEDAIAYVEEGLHSYSSTAIELVQFFAQNSDYNGDIIVVECVVPKGAKYYVGTFGGYDSIASDRLRTIRILGKEDVSSS